MNSKRGGVPVPVHRVGTVLWASLLLSGESAMVFQNTRSLLGDPLPKCEVPGRLLSFCHEDELFLP